MTAALHRPLVLALAVAALPLAGHAQAAGARDGRITVVVLPFTIRTSQPPRHHAHAPHVIMPRPGGRFDGGYCFTAGCRSRFAPGLVEDGGVAAGAGLDADAVAAGRVGEADASPGEEPPMPVMPAGSTSGETGIGAIAAELLVEQLLASGRFRVLDARQLEALQLERARADSARGGARSPGARRPAAGEIYLLQGSVTRLGGDESTVGAGAGGGGLLGVVGIRRRETQVGLAARLVDAATGEVIASESAVGRSRKGKGLLVGGMGIGGAGGVMAGGRNETTALGQAMGRAVRELGRDLGEALERRRGSGGGQGAADTGAKDGGGS